MLLETTIWDPVTERRGGVYDTLWIKDRHRSSNSVCVCVMSCIAAPTCEFCREVDASRTDHLASPTGLARSLQSPAVALPNSCSASSRSNFSESVPIRAGLEARVNIRLGIVRASYVQGGRYTCHRTYQARTIKGQLLTRFQRSSDRSTLR